jgi:hypothetical protein
MADTNAHWMKSGFTDGEEARASLNYLKGHMAVLPAYFQGLTEEQLLFKATPEKWSGTPGGFCHPQPHQVHGYTTHPFSVCHTALQPGRAGKAEPVSGPSLVPPAHIVGKP